MLLHVQRPTAALAPHVDYLWSLRDAAQHATERVLPTGTLELVINLAQDSFRIGERAERLRGAIVSGAYGRFFTIDTRDHADVLGVHCKPGGAWPILGVPPGELAGRHWELADLWGAAGVERLRQQLLAARPEQRLALLDAALSARLSERWQLHAACVHARAALASGQRVADVARAAGLSSRRLQSVFLEQVGTTPKLYARLCRFQRALGAIEARADLHWASIALAAGYCDQSHMIREMQAIAGCAPVELVRGRRARVKEHHVALPRTSDSSNR
jgi:AraC-like DNA-binding protein